MLFYLMTILHFLQPLEGQGTWACQSGATITLYPGKFKSLLKTLTSCSFNLFIAESLPPTLWPWED